jgi:glycosyltransferase involved in cell wall biosynthesis
MLLVNRFGRVVDIQDQQVIKSMLKFRRMREATPEEVEAYHQKQAERSMTTSGVTAHNSFYFNTVRNSPDGYGMSRDVIKSELMRLGILPSETNLGQKVGLLYSYPNAVLQMQNDVRLIFTMFESDKIPDDWPEYLREADEVIVPSKWCQKVFKKSGVETTVVPLGYNHRVFKYVERPVPVEENKDFTFIHYNAFNVRKGFFEVVKAFEAEFEPHEPVKLILKTTSEQPPLPLPKSMYPNIEVIKGQVRDFELVNILGRANCMIFPSRGEGFGITPLEAMATGMPAIIPNAHGMTEYFNPDYMLEVKIKEKTPALYRRFKGEDVGDMVLCDVDDLRRQMRYAYNHQREMKQLGKRASEYVKQWTYENTAKMLAEIINKWIAADVPKRPESKFLFVDKI